MRIISVNIGRPQIVLAGGRQYSSAIRRRPVEGAVELTPLGFVGDRVSDEKVHGGPDMAVCCYPFEHYAWWGERLGRTLAIPCFGENLTTVGLFESEVCIGDIFRIGTATLQVTQPRVPCFKLAHNLGEPQAIAWIHENGFSGFYLRVLLTGLISTDDSVALVERRYADLTVDRLLRLRHDKNIEGIMAARLSVLPALSQTWRKHFAKKIQP